MKYSLCFLALAACGGGDSGLADVPRELGKVQCAKLADCCTAEEFDEETLGAENEQACVNLFAAFGSIIFKVYQQSVDAGRMIYHEDVFNDCLALAKAVSCTEFAQRGGESDMVAGCGDPFEGRVADGGECALDDDCISEYCSGDAVNLDGMVTYGTCRDAPTAAQPCDDGECGDGLFCDNGTCAALLPDGAECSTGRQCANGGCTNDDNPDPGVCGVRMQCDGQ